MTDDAPSPAALYEAIFVPAMFAPLAREVLALADLRPGLSALDLACGTGIVARMLAPALGPGGHVVAVDLRPGMIAEASRAPAPDGAPIEWRLGDATALDLPDAGFDLVACQQGLQFFPDRPRALGEMRRVLRPGGQLVLAVWRDLAEQSLLADLTAAEVRHLAALDVEADEIVLPFTLGDRDALTALVTGAGFAQPSVAEVEITARFPSAARFVENVERPYSAVIGEFSADPAAFERFIEAVQADLGPALDRWRDGEGLAFPMRSHVLTARA